MMMVIIIYRDIILLLNNIIIILAGDHYRKSIPTRRVYDVILRLWYLCSFYHVVIDPYRKLGGTVLLNLFVFRIFYFTPIS